MTLPPLTTSTPTPDPMPDRGGEATIQSWWRGLRDPGRNATRSRYSLAKTQRFISYARGTSTLRKLAFVLLFPVPGLLVAFVQPMIPLQKPSLVVLANWGISLNYFNIEWVSVSSGLVMARAACAIDNQNDPTTAIFAVATVAAIVAQGIFLGLSLAWRFAIPFYPALAPWIYVVTIGLSHTLVFRGGHLAKSVRTKLLLYVPSLVLQVSQLTFYTTYSVLFAMANEWQQVLLVVTFLYLKHALRQAIVAVSYHLQDAATETAVAGVEMSASLCQATIMQTTPSTLVTACIIGSEIVLSAVEIRRYSDLKCVVPTDEIIPKALAIIESTAFVGEMSSADNDSLIVVHALEILRAAEIILLVEFFEVTVPFMNACILLVASPLPSALYNPVVRPFDIHPIQLAPAVEIILLYSSLQAVTLAGMCVAMHVRFRLSAIQLVVLVLETHVWSLQGKLLTWLTVAPAVPIVHYGVVFSFKFDFPDAD